MFLFIATSEAGFVLDHKTINGIVDDSIKKLRIKTPNMQEHIANLSGGNQQKVIVARWLANDPDILTHGRAYPWYRCWCKTRDL